MAPVSLPSEVLRLAGCRLEPSGWQQVGSQAKFTRPVTSEINARLDFTFGIYDKPPRVTVTPYIAVVHEGVEAARKFIADKPLYTINKQIQEIMGDLQAHYRCPSRNRAWRVPPINALEGMTLARLSIPKESLALAYCVQGTLAEAEEALRDEINAAQINPQDIADQQLPKYQELFGLQLDLGPS